MAGAGYQADNVTPPMASTTEVSTVRLFAASTGHYSNVVPASFLGKYVKLTALNGNVHYHFSTDGAVAVDRTVASSSAGASSTALGDYLAQGQSDHVRLPKPGRDTSVYFNREADSTTAVVYMRLSSD